jgi:hypothetical protein
LYPALLLNIEGPVKFNRTENMSIVIAQTERKPDLHNLISVKITYVAENVQHVCVDPAEQPRFALSSAVPMREGQVAEFGRSKLYWATGKTGRRRLTENAGRY